MHSVSHHSRFGSRCSFSTLALISASMLLLHGCSSSNSTTFPKEPNEPTVVTTQSDASDADASVDLVSQISDDNASLQPSFDGNQVDESDASPAEADILLQGAAPEDVRAPEEVIAPEEAIAPEEVSAPADESAPVNVKVTVNIEVPKYQSNELLVKLVWGASTTNAQWVSDELWSAVLEVPDNTEDTLDVTFYDRNGAVELASYSASFKTGQNDVQVHGITAEQFDKTVWDSDEDGATNFDELIDGTDPFFDEYVNAIIIEEDYVDFGIQSLEGRIGAERPYMESFEEIPPVPEEGPPRGLTHTLDVSIDSSGNGTVSEYRQCCQPPWYTTTWKGTRTATDNSVSWVVEKYYYDSDYAHSESTKSSHIVSVFGTDFYRHEGETTYSSRASYQEDKKTQVDIVSQRVENATYCAPMYGTVSFLKTGSTWNPATERIEISVRKSESDSYWKVRTVTVDVKAEQETVDYTLVKNISSILICDFGEI